MKTFRILGVAAALVGLTAWLESRSQRRGERRRERDRFEKTRWEGEGGATPRNPHVSETPPNESPGG